MLVPSPYTWENGEIPNFRDMNDRIEYTLRFLMNPPMIRLRKTNAQIWTTSVSAAISWNFVEVETENMWDATLPTRVKPITPGWYVGTFGGTFAASSVGYREFDIRKNNSGTERTMRIKVQPSTAGGPVVARGNMFMEQFNGTTDYIEAIQWQNAGGGLANTFATIEDQPDLVLRWFAPL